MKDLSANRHERTVFLTWTPGKAQVQIRQAQSIPDITPGQIVSLKTAERFGVPLNEISQLVSQRNGRNAKDKLKI